MKKRLISILLALALLCSLALSQRLQVTHYTLASEKLSSPATLAVLTDLHNSMFGKKQSELAGAIRAADPDAVLCVGDMAESVGELGGMRALAEALGGEFPIFYVTGNHEFSSGEGGAMCDEIRAMGVCVLRGEDRLLPCGLRIAGLDDPAFMGKQQWTEQLDSLRARDDTFTVLMAHRPERANRYAEGFDLIVSGHAHGGQVRIPLLLEGGLWAPNQGFFPEYASGMHDIGDGKLVVSRGLSKGFPPRIFNRPELVILHLEPENR